VLGNANIDSFDKDRGHAGAASHRALLQTDECSLHHAVSVADSSRGITWS